jgi:hypothetical protein
MWILCSVWKMIFPSIRRSFQKRKYVIFLDIGEIFERGSTNHQTKRRVSHNTSPLSVEGYTILNYIWIINKCWGKICRRRRTNGRIKGRVGTVLGICVYRFPNFHIFRQFPFQIPYNLAHFFQFSITFSNSFLPFQFHFPIFFDYVKKNHIFSLLFNKVMFIWYEIPLRSTLWSLPRTRKITYFF